MAVNLATKYSDKVLERFTKKSVTEAMTSNEYDWDGVQTIKVFSIPVIAMGPYTRSGTTRYGTPTDLQDTISTYTLTQDRACTFVIDKGDNVDQLNIKAAGKAMARQNDEVIVPEIEKYRLTTWQASAVANGGSPAAAAITASNAYSALLAGNQYLDENLTPLEGRTAFVTPDMYNYLKLDPTFLKASDIGQQMLINGQVGEVDGIRIVKVPTTWMPTKTKFILTHKSTMVSPKKLQEFKVHDNPPGINGNLVEMRVYYDAFIMDTRKKSIYAHLIP